MKKILALLIGALSINAYSTDTFNTLDTNGTSAATQSGVWTVQPGNTANTTPWLVTPGGNVASGATDSGNPMKMGGVYNSTIPTFTTGQRGDVQIGSRGSLHVELWPTDSSSPIVTNTGAADAQATARGLQVSTYLYGWNGASFDRLRSGITAPTATLTGFQNALSWAVYNTTPTVRTEGQGGPMQSDASGNLLVNTAASATGAYSFSNLKANATTTVKSGAGTLHTISVNTKGITNTVTVYDNTAGSGTTIATIDTTIGQDTLIFDLAFATGLTIVIAGGTAADITITYK